VAVVVLRVSILLTVFGFGLQTTLHDLQCLVRGPGLPGRSLLVPRSRLPSRHSTFPNEPNLGATILLYLIVLTIVTVPCVRWQRHVSVAAQQ
jgi:hypothetical protein